MTKIFYDFLYGCTLTSHDKKRLRNMCFEKLKLKDIYTYEYIGNNNHISHKETMNIANRKSLSTSSISSNGLTSPIWGIGVTYNMVKLWDWK